MFKPTLLAMAAVSIVACAVDPSVPSGDMKIYETCLRTLCDDSSSSGSSACSACMSACSGASYDCDPSTACEASCSPRKCSDYDKNTCEDKGFKVTLPNDPSPEIANACRGMLSHVADCGYTMNETASDCDRYAAVEVPSNASSYDCVAQLDCSTMQADAASCEAPPSTVGDDFCSSFCGGCTDSQQQFLNNEGAIARPDALAALQTCLSQPTCDESSNCLSAWISATE